MLVVSVQVVDGNACPNACSGHGDGSSDIDANAGKQIQGQTHSGLGRLSLRECPRGPAWVDVAIGVDNAHNVAECSNKGNYDYTTGHCT